MGASVIEKHFTLARADGGPDAAFSLEPAEFTALVRGLQGRPGRRWAGCTTTSWARERGSLLFRRSLYVTADVKAGEPLSRAQPSGRSGRGTGPGPRAP